MEVFRPGIEPEPLQWPLSWSSCFSSHSLAHWPCLEESHQVSCMEEPEFPLPGLDAVLQTPCLLSLHLVFFMKRWFPVSNCVSALKSSLYSLENLRDSICHEPPPGAALTHTSSQSPYPVTSPCALWVSGGYSIPFQYPRSCDGGVPTYLESITRRFSGILRCKPYVVFFLQWPIYLTYLYLFNFYSEVYPVTIALA